MGEISDYALSSISLAQRKVEVAAQNLANAATPAYKRRIAFSTLVQSARDGAQLPQMSIAIDQRIGKIVETGNPADFALGTQGVFSFRNENEVAYSRVAQLAIDGDGRLINDRGFALQLTNGSDLVVRSKAFKVERDGTVVDRGEVLGKIAVFGIADEAVDLNSAATTSVTDLIASPSIRQGALETSNVVTGDEMVVLIEAMRRAEAGQRIMSVYDELLGRAITSFGENVR